MKLAALALALLLAPAAAQGVVEGETGKLLDAHVRALDADTGGFCGAVLVASKGKILLEQGYGLADAKAGRKITPDDLFDWASVSKQFTAAAVLQLEMQKKLSIRDKLARFFPKAPADKAEITLQQLLSHTSGLPKGFDPAWKWDPASRQSLFDLALALPLASKPGTKFEYNNMPYGFLAALVEELARLTERSFRSEVARQRHPTGLGLGLSIAKDVSERHGFTCTLKKSEHGGLEVEFRGPRLVRS